MALHKGNATKYKVALHKGNSSTRSKKIKQNKRSCLFDIVSSYLKFLYNSQFDAGKERNLWIGFCCKDYVTLSKLGFLFSYLFIYCCLPMTFNMCKFYMILHTSCINNAAHAY